MARGLDVALDGLEAIGRGVDAAGERLDAVAWRMEPPLPGPRPPAPPPGPVNITTAYIDELHHWFRDGGTVPRPGPTIGGVPTIIDPDHEGPPRVVPPAEAEELLHGSGRSALLCVLIGHEDDGAGGCRRPGCKWPGTAIAQARRYVRELEAARVKSDARVAALEAAARTLIAYRVTDCDDDARMFVRDLTCVRKGAIARLEAALEPQQEEHR